MLRLLLIRHALCDSVGVRLHGRTEGIRLNAAGREQADRLSTLLKDQPLAVCRTSPVLRAVETARAVCNPHGLEPDSCDDFTEIDFGYWTGRAVADLESDPVWADFNHLRSTTRIPGGESMSDVQARALRGVHTLQEEYDGSTVAVVSHSDVIRTLVSHLLCIPLDAMLRFDIAPASVTTFELHGSWPRLISLNQTFTAAPAAT